MADESALLQKINADLINAMKSKHELKVSTLRMIKSAIKYKEVDLKRAIRDEEVIDVLTHMAKQHRESIHEFEKGGRLDSSEKEKAELALIETYLPESLPEDEVIRLIEEAIQVNQAMTLKDMGKVMAWLTPKVKGRVSDLSQVSSRVRSKLS
jgi:uncharacterized protein YqeY